MTIVDNGNVAAKLTTLSNEDAGSYKVTTSSGSGYVLNLDNRTVVRHSADESDWFGDLNRSKSHGLLNIVSCEVGKGMVLILDEAIPGNKSAVGQSFSTSVVRIEKN